MIGQRIVLPNDTDSFIVEEIKERLEKRLTVRIAFGGNSMYPTIDGNSDYVHLAPLGDKLHEGEIYLFINDGHCVIHRLVRIQPDGMLDFRGDNNTSYEYVGRDAVLAHLVSVEHSDGSIESCDSARFRHRSRRALIRHALHKGVHTLFCRRQRLWQRWIYFPLLIVLMWAPMGVLGVPLDNFVFGIRLDHLIHASIFIPCTLYLMDFGPQPTTGRRRIGVSVWIVAILIGITTETVQYLLPYRGFDINDLAANFLGVTIGWLALRLASRRK